MKQFIFFLTLIYFSFCSMESCNDITDQEKCNAEPIGVDGLYCFKANIENENVDKDMGEHKTECMTFPIDPDNQKIFFKFVNGIIKESLSSYGKLPEEYTANLYESLESQIWESRKESYAKEETIEIGPGKLSNEDKTILKSEQTCSYYYFGRYFKNLLFYDDKGPNTNYENIKDKNICYNAKKFSEFNNLIDCGYAEIKVTLDGREYNINTCYLIPTANLPEMFNEPYSDFQKGFLIDYMLNTIIKSMAGKGDDGDGEDLDNRIRRRRRLETDLSFEIAVENKYGRKITFSSKNANSYTVDAEGSPGNDRASYLGINLILSFLIFVL